MYWHVCTLLLKLVVIARICAIQMGPLPNVDGDDDDDVNNDIAMFSGTSLT